MNNSKIWLVVNPTVGVPLFLGAVAVGSFSVHVAVLSNTTWVSDFLSGKELGSGSDSASLNILPDANTDTASFVETVDGSKMLVKMPDGSFAMATIDRPPEVASLAHARPDRSD
jgi:light-harvesting protein B-800-850 alpha chain